MRARTHWPLRFGYFESSSAAAASIANHSAAAVASAPIRLLPSMLFSLSLTARRTQPARPIAGLPLLLAPKKTGVKEQRPAVGTLAALYHRRDCGTSRQRRLCGKA